MNWSRGLRHSGFGRSSGCGGVGRDEAPALSLLGGRTGSAEEILRERFARGEISAEEYVKSYEVLREKPSQRSYEDYVRDAMARLRPGRGTGS